MNGQPDLSRTVVVGTSCSGKTVFARQLAARLRARHIELDAFHWLPHWQPRASGEFLALVGQAAAAPAWVVDGNYSRARPLLWQRASAVVWLNYPFSVVFARALRRTLLRAATREELWSGNCLRLALLSRNSILWWVLTTYRRRQREYRSLFDQQPWPYLGADRARSPAPRSALSGDPPGSAGIVNRTAPRAARSPP